MDKGELTFQALARHEPRLVTEIKALEDAAHASVAPVVRDVAGPDAGARWGKLSLDQRKELLLNVADIRLLKTQAGADRIRSRGAIRAEQAARRIQITWKAS